MHSYLHRYQAYIVIPNDTEKRVTRNNDWGHYCHCHIVTNVSVILNEEHTKQPISPLLRERHVHVWHFSNEMNGVGSAVILALMRPPRGGGGAAITENWQTGGSVFASCKSDIMIVKCHFLGNKKRNNWCAQLSADGVRETWEAGDWQMDKDPETCQ